MESSAVITADMLSGLTSIVTDNVQVLIPAGIGIMAIMVGVSLIPKVIKKFF